MHPLGSSFMGALPTFNDSGTVNKRWTLDKSKLSSVSPSASMTGKTPVSSFFCSGPKSGGFMTLTACSSSVMASTSTASSAFSATSEPSATSWN
ncbi:hypothetical protein PsorP6_007086 [Peronosclerospora sorghi]|uniref:Uncharacterized protein n=1 Tax=Peronosclerospora sorghi TaxID=230839 RepID=A0ACC0W9I8_9STRA|nr:hypothetical protein PsorP6_007086 [Peronosclerospora sorghi]